MESLIEISSSNFKNTIFKLVAGMKGLVVFI